MSKVDEVKSKVLIPKYFEEIIVPQLGDYYADYTVNFDVRPFVCCPLHDENTPSMKYYEETNTFYCFGCRAGGDVIQLHRLYNEKQSGVKPSFKDSVEYLYDYFVKRIHQTDKKRTYQRIVNKKHENSNVQLLRYEKYRTSLNNMVMADNTISEDKKVRIYDIIDEMDSLMEKQMVLAEDVIAYLNSYKDSVLRG